MFLVGGWGGCWCQVWCEYGFFYFDWVDEVYVVYVFDGCYYVDGVEDWLLVVVGGFYEVVVGQLFVGGEWWLVVVEVVVFEVEVEQFDLVFELDECDLVVCGWYEWVVCYVFE